MNGRLKAEVGPSVISSHVRRAGNRASPATGTAVQGSG